MTSRRRVPADRRGSALVLVLVMTVALAALALSAIYMSSNAMILGKYFERERDFRYGADAALAYGKSRVNNDPKAQVDTGYVQLLRDAPINGVDGKPIPGVLVNVWTGVSGLTSGRNGSFRSVVADAHDRSGIHVVRRLELTQESFAKFAYWSDRETNLSNQRIYFGNGDQIFGPVWSNDVISITSGGATFNDEVGTAKTVSGIGYGTFKKGVKQRQKPIALPTNSRLANLPGLAASGSLAFTPPTNGDETTTSMRLEFVPVDLNGNGDVSDVDEGFVRVYGASSASLLNRQYVRGDFTPYNCGDWHVDSTTHHYAFYPIWAHRQSWFVNYVAGTSTSARSAMSSHAALSDGRIATTGTGVQHCFLGGDPHLAPYARSIGGYTAAQAQKGGEDTTFTPSDPLGSWRSWPGVVDSRVAAREDAGYLFPLYRGLNTGSQGVIYADGTIGVSGTLRGQVTLYASGTITILDDVRYTNLQNMGCLDMLGLIAANDVKVADNALNTPQKPSGASKYTSMDLDSFLQLQAVVMALSHSFGVEDYDQAPYDAVKCGAADAGRGCLYLAGGIIQDARGAVGQSSGYGFSGFVKRYSYDRCVAQIPPPYFPTTGRYEENTYYEIDPTNFSIADYWARITSR